MQKTISNPNYLKLLEWLKEARTSQDLTMRDVGALIGEPHSVVGKIETAERRLDVSEFVEYCQAIGIDPVEGLQILLN